MLTVWNGLNLKVSFLFSMTDFDLYIEIHWWPQTHTIHTHTWWKTNLRGYPQCRQQEINNSEFTPLNSRLLCLYSLSLSASRKRGVKKTNGRVKVTHFPTPLPMQSTPTSFLLPEAVRGIAQHRAGSQRHGKTLCCWITEGSKRELMQMHSLTLKGTPTWNFIQGWWLSLEVAHNALSLCIQGHQSLSVNGMTQACENRANHPSLPYHTEWQLL